MTTFVFMLMILITLSSARSDVHQFGIQPFRRWHKNDVLTSATLPTKKSPERP